MYYSPPTLKQADPQLAGSAQELLRSTARTLVIATMGLLAVALALMWVKPPADLDVTAIPILVLAALAGIVVLLLVTAFATAAFAQTPDPQNAAPAACPMADDDAACPMTGNGQAACPMARGAAIRRDRR